MDVWLKRAKLKARLRTITYTWDCHVCKAHLESRPGETWGEFNVRVYDTHVVYHDLGHAVLPRRVKARSCQRVS